MTSADRKPVYVKMVFVKDSGRVFQGNDFMNIVSVPLRSSNSDWNALFSKQSCANIHGPHRMNFEDIVLLFTAVQ